MITLQVEEYCQKCSDFQPCVEKLYAGGEIVMQNILCENQKRCANIYEFAKKSSKGE